MLRTATRTALAALAVLLGTASAEAQARESCIAAYRLGHWHHPEILAELTQLNGPRSQAELDATARELVRWAAEPDADAVVETIRTHFADGIRSDYERAIACTIRNGTDVGDIDLDAAVARTIENRREDAAQLAEAMANTTLDLAAHRHRHTAWLGVSGTPYAGAFDAAAELFDATEGRAGTWLIKELDPERAAAVLEPRALRSGPAACHALYSLRHWSENPGPDWRPLPHPSYERLRRESPERCPELDDPPGP